MKFYALIKGHLATCMCLMMVAQPIYWVATKIFVTATIAATLAHAPVVPAHQQVWQEYDGYCQVHSDEMECIHITGERN